MSAPDPPGALPQAASAWIFDEHGDLLLVRENYDRRRYGPPGGAVEAGESPFQAVVREVAEETCAAFELEGLIGIYHFRYPDGAREPWLAFCFAGVLVGEPKLPLTGEIAELGWFAPRALPRPCTNLLRYALEDACSGRRGLARTIHVASTDAR